ncbi:GDSL-like Lipase/Acylhydrolase [Pseudomassariella vexata]|uniref:GDSL-like Lipase/Acylhydrolase n=1 Tax=Pseudomassariella vexata TaxID=1141098 RepID=A0A1Y2DQ87_9PEZI|nr:GDSL-like Lipase/Acylhydrolase [Pseudomassariella vexata]ORY61276.1 GDSL-like Lipase/Acylhydrolase [Pseudomassariella vexata]
MVLPLLSLASLATSNSLPITGADFDLNDLVSRAATNIYLAGDSTMSSYSSGAIQGWGQYVQYSFPSSTYKVQNKAIGGRSARSFTRESRFQAIADSVVPGDWVIIEFGHNDGGSLGSGTDNGRTDCFGDGEQTCATTYDNVAETVHTFPWYLKAAAKLYLAKGAKVVLSTATPNNVWESGRWSWGPDRFYYYNWHLGGPEAGVYFVPHGEYAAQAMNNLGASVVNANYPNDHTHTAPYLADIMAGSFVLGLKCGTSDLGAAVLNSTSSLTSTVLGPCISHNNTLNALGRREAWGWGEVVS